MTADRAGPPQSVPILTEVIEWPAPGTESQPSAAAGDAEPRRVAGPGAAIDEDELVGRVLHSLQQQLDGVLEYRIREALTPILTRAADALVRDARHEVSRSLGDLVSRAVAEELRRQRQGRDGR